MSKGNQEIRFRASQEIHNIIESTQNEIQGSEKSAAAKLLIKLGDDRIKDVVNYVNSITHPLNDKQFNDFFLALKIRILQRRKGKTLTKL